MTCALRGRHLQLLEPDLDGSPTILRNDDDGLSLAGYRGDHGDPWSLRIAPDPT
jgi:hypothetical protein